MSAQGTAVSAEGWTLFEQVWFENDQARIGPKEMYKISNLATYAQQHPSSSVGIDSLLDPYTPEGYRRSLSLRRVDAVRNALIDAGVPANRIQPGVVGLTRNTCAENATSENNNECRRIGMLFRNNN